MQIQRFILRKYIFFKIIFWVLVYHLDNENNNYANKLKTLLGNQETEIPVLRKYNFQTIFSISITIQIIIIKNSHSNNNYKKSHSDSIHLTYIFKNLNAQHSHFFMLIFFDTTMK